MSSNKLWSEGFLAS